MLYDLTLSSFFGTLAFPSTVRTVRVGEKKTHQNTCFKKIIELAGFEPTHLRYEPWPVTSELTRMLTGLILLRFKDKVSKS